MGEKLYCKFCGKECKNINSLTQHQIKCQKNPNRYGLRPKESYINLSDESRKKLGWSKGLTKETDERVLHNSIGVIKSLSKRIPGKAYTKLGEIERCSKISRSMKNNPNAGGLRKNSGTGKKGIYKGYYCDSTYELVYVIYNIDHNIKFNRNTYYYEYFWEGVKHKYYPDFILSDGTLIEIKGYMTDKVKCKLDSVKDRKITLLLRDDLEYAFNYVRDNYKYVKLTDLYENVGEL